MKITFLGTGTSQGVPIISCECDVCLSDNKKDKRLRASILIEWEDHSIVIDSGPDFRYQMLRANVKSLDGVVFTHEHKDHVAGLDDIRPFNYFSKKDIKVYATDNVEKALKREFHYIFSGANYPGIPKINLIKIKNASFKIFNKTFIPVEGMHHKLPVFGYRIDDFCYITDMNYISEKEKEKLHNLDVLVLNALRNESHISHFTLLEAIELVKELKPKQAYFTHISHQLGAYNEIEPSLPKGINLAYDGLSFHLSE